MLARSSWIWPAGCLKSLCVLCGVWMFFLWLSPPIQRHKCQGNWRIWTAPNCEYEHERLTFNLPRILLLLWLWGKSNSTHISLLRVFCSYIWCVLISLFITLSQEVPEVHLGLDLHLYERFHHPSLPLSPSLHLSFPPPPLSSRPHGFALVELSAPPDPAGGCSGDLLRAHDPRPGRPEPGLPSTASAAPAWRPEQGLLPESPHAVARLRSLPGRPHPLLLLSAACWGNVCLWSSLGATKASAEVTRNPAESRLPPVCSSPPCLDVSAAVFACILPKVSLPAAGWSSGLPGVERTLSRIV